MNHNVYYVSLLPWKLLHLHVRVLSPDSLSLKALFMRTIPVSIASRMSSWPLLFPLFFYYAGLPLLFLVRGSDVTSPPPLREGLPGSLGATRHPSVWPPQRRSQPQLCLRRCQWQQPSGAPSPPGHSLPPPHPSHGCRDNIERWPRGQARHHGSRLRGSGVSQGKMPRHLWSSDLSWSPLDLSLKFLFIFFFVLTELTFQSVTAPPRPSVKHNIWLLSNRLWAHPFFLPFPFLYSSAALALQASPLFFSLLPPPLSTFIPHSNFAALFALLLSNAPFLPKHFPLHLHFLSLPNGRLVLPQPPS